MTIKKIFLCITLTSFLFYCFHSTSLVKESVFNSLLIWINYVFPTLFPFFVLISISIKLEIITIFNHFLYPVLKFFFVSLSKNACFIIVTSLFTGNPSNAKMIVESIDNNIISTNTGNKLLCFTSFANPVFVMFMIKTSYINNQSAIFLLFIAHYLSNFIIGIVVMYKGEKDTISKSTAKNNICISDAVNDAISSSLDTLIMICGTMIFFNLLANIIIESHIINHLVFFVEMNNTIVPIFISGMIEFVNGIHNVISLNLSIKETLCIICFYLGFGGLSIHMQVFNIIKNHNLNMKNFFISRIIQGILSVFIILILFDKLFDDNLTITTSFVKEYHQNYYIIIFMCITLLYFIGSTIYKRIK